jgi:hypothetical protein
MRGRPELLVKHVSRVRECSGRVVFLRTGVTSKFLVVAPPMAASLANDDR